jgi:hypothetical protein
MINVSEINWEDVDWDDINWDGINWDDDLRAKIRYFNDTLFIGEPVADFLTFGRVAEDLSVKLAQKEGAFVTELNAENKSSALPKFSDEVKGKLNTEWKLSDWQLVKEKIPGDIVDKFIQILRDGATVLDGKYNLVLRKEDSSWWRKEKEFSSYPKDLIANDKNGYYKLYFNREALEGIISLIKEIFNTLAEKSEKIKELTNEAGAKFSKWETELNNIIEENKESDNHELKQALAGLTQARGKFNKHCSDVYNSFGGEEIKIENLDHVRENLDKVKKGLMKSLDAQFRELGKLMSGTENMIKKAKWKSLLDKVSTELETPLLYVDDNKLDLLKADADANDSTRALSENKKNKTPVTIQSQNSHVDVTDDNIAELVNEIVIATQKLESLKTIKQIFGDEHVLMDGLCKQFKPALHEEIGEKQKQLELCSGEFRVIIDPLSKGAGVLLWSDFKRYKQTIKQINKRLDELSKDVNGLQQQVKENNEEIKKEAYEYIHDLWLNNSKKIKEVDKTIEDEVLFNLGKRTIGSRDNKWLEGRVRSKLGDMGRWIESDVRSIQIKFTTKPLTNKPLTNKTLGEFNDLKERLNTIAYTMNSRLKVIVKDEVNSYCKKKEEQGQCEEEFRQLKKKFRSYFCSVNNENEGLNFDIEKEVKKHDPKVLDFFKDNKEIFSEVESLLFKSMTRDDFVKSFFSTHEFKDDELDVEQKIENIKAQIKRINKKILNTKSSTVKAAVETAVHRLWKMKVESRLLYYRKEALIVTEQDEKSQALLVDFNSLWLASERDDVKKQLDFYEKIEENISKLEKDFEDLSCLVDSFVPELGVNDANSIRLTKGSIDDKFSLGEKITKMQEVFQLAVLKKHFNNLQSVKGEIVKAAMTEPTTLKAVKEAAAEYQRQSKRLQDKKIEDYLRPQKYQKRLGDVLLTEGAAIYSLNMVERDLSKIRQSDFKVDIIKEKEDTIAEIRCLAKLLDSVFKTVKRHNLKATGVKKILALEQALYNELELDSENKGENKLTAWAANIQDQWTSLSKYSLVLNGVKTKTHNITEDRLRDEVWINGFFGFFRRAEYRENRSKVYEGVISDLEMASNPVQQNVADDGARLEAKDDVSQTGSVPAA